MGLTRQIDDTYEGLTVADLGGQNSYTEAIVSLHSVNVTATSPLAGSNSVTFISTGANDDPITVEKAVGATRGTSDAWTISFLVRVESTATTVVPTAVALTAGAASATYATDALRVGFQRNSVTGVVDMLIWDRANAPSGGWVSARTVTNVFALDTTVTIVIRIEGDDSYQILVDTNSDDEGYTFLASGNLVAANEAITRFNYCANGTNFVSSTHRYDNFRIILRTNDTKAALGERPERQAQITAANLEGNAVKVTIEIVSALTGAALQSRTRDVPKSQLLSSGNGTLSRQAIDQILEEELLAYDQEQRVGTLVGYQVRK